MVAAVCLDSWGWKLWAAASVLEQFRPLAPAQAGRGIQDRLKLLCSVCSRLVWSDHDRIAARNLMICALHG